MIRFAYSTNAYVRWPLAEAIADVRASGFEAVEILADVPHLRADEGEPAWEEVRRALDGFPVANLNANTAKALDPGGVDPEGFWPSLAEEDLDNRWARRIYVEQCLQAAARLGARSISIATAPAARFAAPHEALEVFAEELGRLLKVAEQVGVRIGIEFEPGHLLAAVADAHTFLEGWGHPLLGVNLDIGHVVCAGEDPAQAVRAFAGRIWNVHLEDIRGRAHRHLVPGEGDVDLRGVLEALRVVGYDGFVTLELYPYADDPGGAGRRGLAHLRALTGV